MRFENYVANDKTWIDTMKRRLLFTLLIFVLLPVFATSAQDSAPASLTPVSEPATATPVAVDTEPVEDETITDTTSVEVIPGSMIQIDGEQIYLPMVHGQDLEQAVISMAAVQPAALPDFGPFDPRRIPIELQSWWVPAYGHIHAAVMIPFGQAISGVVNVPVRIVMHNNPGQLFMFRVDDEQSVRVKMPLDLRCPTTICAWSFTVPLDTGRFPNGWRMFRFRAQVKTPDGKAFLNSSDIPMLVSNSSGGGGNVLRFGSTNYIVGKGWYDGFDYTNVAIEHAPIAPVKGLLRLRVQVHKGGSNLAADLDKSHFIPAVGPWPLTGDTPGVPLLAIASSPGEWRDIVIDTVPLVNGWHSFQVRTDNPDGAVSVCTGCPNTVNHPAGIAKFWFYVQNDGGTAPTATSVPVATVTPVPGTPAPATPTAAATATGAPVATNTQVPAPTLTPAPPTTATPSAGGASCLWICRSQIQQLPMSGGGWSNALSLANSNPGAPDLDNQDSDINTQVMAMALVWARTGDEQYRVKVVSAIRSIVENQSENGGRTLALGRELGAYVVAADLIDLRNHDPALYSRFLVRLRELRTKTLDGRTLISTHEDRANNWGTMAGGTRAAIAVYLGDRADLDRTFAVFCGWTGEHNLYNGHDFGDLDWQSDPNNPMGVNPVGAMKQGHSIDGALPEEMRRGGTFKWPPAPTGYPWGGLSGAVMTAEILENAGYPAWECGDQALLRAAQFLYGIGWTPGGDDVGIPPLLNVAYGANFSYSGFAAAKNFCCTGWTHASATVAAAMDAAPAAQMEVGPRVVVAESPGDLKDEVEYLMSLGWGAVGEVTDTVDEDGDVVYAQMMMHGNMP